jgi:membrane protein implicated in regulation of membrane protease activity
MMYTPYPVELWQYASVGTVSKEIAPDQRGRVHFDATDWPARFYGTGTDATLEPDSKVYVLGRQGLTLLVQPKL